MLPVSKSQIRARIDEMKEEQEKRVIEALQHIKTSVESNSTYLMWMDKKLGKIAELMEENKSSENVSVSEDG